MLKPPPILRKSWDLLNRFPMVLVLAFLLEGSVLFSHLLKLPFYHFGTVFLLNLIVPFLRLIFIVIQVYALAGVLGLLAEIACGHELAIVKHHLTTTGRRFWKMVLAAFMIPLMLHLFFFITLSHTLPLNVITALLFPLMAYILARSILRALPYEKITLNPCLSWKDALWLTALYVVNIQCAVSANQPSLGFMNFSNICLFGNVYLQLLIYGYCLYLILPQQIKQAQPGQGRELYLITPPGEAVFSGLASFGFWTSPPWFVVLRALTPAHYKIREFNRVSWQDDYAQPNKLVAISPFTCNSYEAYAIAKAFKQKGSTVIIGGPHVTYLPDEAMAFCDSVVVGAAEGVWPQILHDYENGCLKPRYDGFVDSATDEVVHQQLLKSDPHVISAYIQTSRGCKFNCDFCAVPGLNQRTVIYKPLEKVMELLHKIKASGYQSTYFVDNNIYSNPAYTRKLLEAMVPLKMKWNGCASIDIAKNRELLRLAQKSGCTELLVGYEIASDSEEKAKGGKMSMAHQYVQLTRELKKVGIGIKGHFIIGFDSDNLRSIFRLWKSAFAIFPTYSVISLLTPMPGSTLYTRMLQENRMVNLNWRSYACHNLVFSHPNLNVRLMNMFNQFLVVFFLLTTSFVGVVLLCVVLFIFVIA